MDGICVHLGCRWCVGDGVSDLLCSKPHQHVDGDPMRYVVVLALVLLAGCEDGPKPLRSQKTNNNDYSVDYLFTQDGCKVYRFSDKGYWHHFTTCGEAMTQHSCGKSCTKDDNIQ